MVLNVRISNQTLFGLKTEVERYSLITWSSLSLITNLVGNSIVLLATIKYKAIKLDKVSVILIQNIAVSDILMGLNTIFPILTSLITDKWIFGDILCYVQHYMKVPIFLSAELLICAMHINKLTCLTFPLKSIYKKHTTGYVLAVSMWVLACVIPSVQFYVDKASITFDYRLYRCHYVFRAPVWKWARPLLLSTIMIVPNILVLLSTVTLMIFVWRKRRKINLQGAITSVYIGLAYVIAFGPVAVNQSIIINLYPIMAKDTRSFFFVVFSRIAFFTTFLNGMSNVFIYTVSVKSFGDFVSMRMIKPLRVKMRILHRALSFHSLQGQKSSSTRPSEQQPATKSQSVQRQVEVFSSAAHQEAQQLSKQE